MVIKKKIQSVFRSTWSTPTWSVRNNDWDIQKHISEQDANNLFSLIATIQDNAPTMSKGTTIAIDKSSDIPRPKLKEFINDNGFKKVSKIDKADVITIRRESVKMIQNEGIKSKLFLCDDDLDKIAAEYNMLPAMLVTNKSDDSDIEFFEVKNRCIEKKGIFINTYRNKKQEEQIDFLFSLIGSKATLIYDDVLMNEINSDGLDLDDDIYETLEGMLMSKETETFNLGIEMLSNVNLENNLFKISVLLNKVSNQTYRFNAMSQIKNKNFKALVNYVESSGIRWNQKWESFSMSMLNKFRGTVWEANILEYMVSCLNKHFGRMNGNDVLQITNIVFK
jgi:hypothetical protein